MRILNFLTILLIIFQLFSCICNKDKIDIAEGRELYDEELKIIPYEEGDTLRFMSNNEIQEFICSYRKHYYDKGKPSYRSHNECEGQTLRSQDRLEVTLKTDLTAYNYQNGKVNQFDSVNIGLTVKSNYYDDTFSEFGFGMQGPFFGRALLYIIDNEISFQEEDRPSYDYYIFSYYDTISINNVIYNKVISFENNYPLSDKIPYYYSKLFYNEEFGIIQLMRSDGIIYDLVNNR